MNKSYFINNTSYPHNITLVYQALCATTVSNSTYSKVNNSQRSLPLGLFGKYVFVVCISIQAISGDFFTIKMLSQDRSN